MNGHGHSPTSRRGFCAGATGVLLGSAAPAPYGRFTMGVQSYSLRHFDLARALDATKGLGLADWEAYPNHLPITTDPGQLDGYRTALARAGIRLRAYGVVDFSNDEADARSKFAFARAMRIRTLSAYPQPAALPLVDRLAGEYGVDIAIHNHGPGDSLYGLVNQVFAAFAGRSPRIGACIDAGHFLRAQQDPVKAAELFGRRVHGIHLKNVKIDAGGERVFTELDDPAGLLDMVGLFRTLRRNRYDHLVSLEYEEHEEDPVPYMARCLTAARAAIAKAG